jgi:hypothetical protein
VRLAEATTGGDDIKAAEIIDYLLLCVVKSAGWRGTLNHVVPCFRYALACLWLSGAFFSRRGKPAWLSNASLEDTGLIS